MNKEALGNTQGSILHNPSQTFGFEKNDDLYSIVKNDINFFLYGSKDIVKDFVSKESKNENVKILLAVSGGVDSQVMLHCVHSLTKLFNYSLSVVTINHNLRESKETKADADLVYNYCTNDLGLPCKIITIEKNAIEIMSKERDRGIEEAARHIRYKHIKEHAITIGAHVVFFAHNKNDQLETLLQHFLQGSVAGISGFASSGIRQYLSFPFSEKGSTTESVFLFRPLLRVSRKDIEAYANRYSIPFRTDSTNDEITYLRNKLRHTLVPVLNDFFPGWETGVLKGSEKAFQESLFVDHLASKLVWEEVNGVRVKISDFLEQGFPVRIRALYNAFKLVNIDGRVSYDVVEACALGQKRVEGSGVEAFHKGGYLIVRPLETKYKNNDTICIDVTKEGIYKTTYGTFEVKATVQKSTSFADIESGNYYIGNFLLPLKIRSKKPGETILTAQGTHKSVKKVFSEWRVDECHRNAIPFIEYNGESICIWGSPYGYSNWYVKQDFEEERQQYYIQFIRNN